jgi:hypothetical protein
MSVDNSMSPRGERSWALCHTGGTVVCDLDGLMVVVTELVPVLGVVV